MKMYELGLKFTDRYGDEYFIGAVDHKAQRYIIVDETGHYPINFDRMEEFMMPEEIVQSIVWQVMREI